VKFYTSTGGSQQGAVERLREIIKNSVDARHADHGATDGRRTRCRTRGLSCQAG
jgi:hypothetical protein